MQTCTSYSVYNANISDQSQPSNGEPGVPPGPHQPSEFSFPARTYGKQTRAFQTHWFRSFPWLHYLETNDSVLCHTCITADRQKKLINAKSSEKAFLVEGFCNWKKALEKFRDHQKSTCHRLAVEHAEFQRMYGDIGEKMNATLAEERKKNRMTFIKILENVKFLSRQGLAFQGNEESGNFLQLHKLRAADDPHLYDWMKKKRDKYTSHDIQTVIVRIMDILRDIADSVSDAKFFSILADECSDASNKEQLTICLRWIDQALEPNEDFVGFYEIPNITANTIVGAIKDVLIRLNLSLNNCRGQCFDAGGPMAGSRNGVAAQILSEVKKAHLTHCHGHALSLAVKDTTEGSKLLRDCMDTTREICKLIKFSPKRQGILEELKNQIQLETPGLKVLCPTRWTIRAESLRRVLDNYTPLQTEWETCLEGKLDSETRARIIGVKSQMQSFDYFFAVNLGEMIFRHTDNLSKTLQKSSMAAVDGQKNAELVRSVLQGMRTDQSFNAFFSVVKIKATEQDVNEPSLRRNRRAPRRLEIGTANPEFATSVEDKYRQIYFEAIDLCVATIKNRFDQPGFKAYMQMESLLIKCLGNEEYSEELPFLKGNYTEDINMPNFEAQLLLFKEMMPRENVLASRMCIVHTEKWTLLTSFSCQRLKFS
ncbi:Zinc finger MYM-type protein 1 [Holothuria leucospilota]|uniref:Zinc finger MYM-type protein 1 n=1 Tax=Holothuria leucospilota TaxID=206669 RepID=A0A9Q1C920_HOLLE|nr:Zinc finger MYM-type protein 1 [Holothuria leucospilota]